MDLSADYPKGASVMSRREKQEIKISQAPIDDRSVDSALQGLLGAYDSLGFERGYARATNHLLATMPLLIEEFDREYVGVSTHDREVLKVFGRFVEEKFRGQVER
jgi:hypothetical protein